MADEIQLAKLREGSKAWNEWRSQQPDHTTIDLQEADLLEADLSGAILSDVDFSYSNFLGSHLSEANFKDTDLTGANFRYADLSEANLSGANLRYANLYRANLSYSNLSCSNLTSSNFSRTILSGTNFSGAILWETVLGDIDLTEVIGLEEIEHLGPSILDYQTLEHSSMLPVNFLRGCGLPDSLIDYLPSILNQPISFYSCFISYSHKDKTFARRLHDQLQGRGIRCWLDDHQMLPGDDIYKQVDEGIKLWDKVLLCASENSLSSWWVDNEIDTAFRKEQQLMRQRNEKVWSLIPLNLDNYMFSGEWKTGKAGQVKSRLAADFTGWENNNEIFERAFEKLVKALQTNNEGREAPPIAKL